MTPFSPPSFPKAHGLSEEASSRCGASGKLSNGRRA
jgi:hypothetical protein